MCLQGSRGCGCWLRQKAALILSTVVATYVVVLAGGAPWIVRALAFPILIVALIMVATSADMAPKCPKI